ncbi:MAG: hypothetical protein TREMPRED_000614 [Tremellales sp. Tagirdzhanova-0007]|nr:MAG: hypothetical protein TREMPRED_000614 [Tremellales sp. Tagirdzhanova-0007]
MGKIVHIVLWKIKRPPAASSKPIEEVLAQARQAISALKSVPGPEYCHLGPPMMDDRAQGYDWGLYSIFASKEDLKTYAVSEAHVKVVTENVRPLTEAGVLAYDFELDD